MAFYNRWRLRLELTYVSPVTYEQLHHLGAALS
jgi:hypothetical protein